MLICHGQISCNLINLLLNKLGFLINLRSSYLLNTGLCILLGKRKGFWIKQEGALLENTNPLIYGIRHSVWRGSVELQKSHIMSFNALCISRVEGLVHVATGFMFEQFFNVNFFNNIQKLRHQLKPLKQGYPNATFPALVTWWSLEWGWGDGSSTANNSTCWSYRRPELKW